MEPSGIHVQSVFDALEAVAESVVAQGAVDLVGIGEGQVFLGDCDLGLLRGDGQA